ncbi:hypothetical protein Q760_09725 [Cellulomonas cellasea DSM 20118]|uniref:Uncharacterized protein n=3 Tax=Cellulomonas cellasea TaxID=43670 RepID=A0A0A0BB15_9CELL|nr:DUF3072 domain-containing protein [Cellulomonas cellasea]KGM03074.1 hypothetical protein Q760_09725 [Cellulomonas cellasea DSM 20118]GEA90018.1 hypothetical protein CCE01nite_39670 [Cellulomonas cellasea]
MANDDTTSPADETATTGTAGAQGSGTAADDAPGVGSPEKDPQDWVTGDEPMTGPQGSYLSTLAREAGEEVPDDLTKAQASELIEELQSRTGRGPGQGA